MQRESFSEPAGKEDREDVDRPRPKRYAYVALVSVPSGRHPRRSYLTLSAAQAAVERAEARGQRAYVQLYELRAVGSDT